jgi:hypothetical protein
VPVSKLSVLSFGGNHHYDLLSTVAYRTTKFFVFGPFKSLQALLLALSGE